MEIINFGEMNTKKWNKHRDTLAGILKDNKLVFNVTRNANGDVFLSGDLIIRFDIEKQELYLHGRCSKIASRELSYMDIKLIRELCLIWYKDITGPVE